jgi:hypothetical protein
VARVRLHKSWEQGPFVNYGNGVGDRTDYHFLWAGYQAGKVMTPVVKAGPLSGQFELGANIMPLWTAFTPAAHSKSYSCGASVTCHEKFGGGNYYGVSLTPVIFRWNFLTRSSRVQPWFQAAGGLAPRAPPACGTSRRRAEWVCITSRGRAGRSISA